MARLLLVSSLGLEMSSKVVNLQNYKEEQVKNKARERLYFMEKVELLDELIKFYEAIKKDPCNIELVLWGEDLMEVISKRALTKELHELAEDIQNKGPHQIFNLKPSKSLEN